jgi:hypothetical protein
MAESNLNLIGYAPLETWKLWCTKKRMDRP